MLGCSCEFLTVYFVSQEWFAFTTAGLHQGSTTNYLKHIFSLLDTPHKADIHHCVSALSSHKLPVIESLILMKRVQACSLWLKHLIEKESQLTPRQGKFILIAFKLNLYPEFRLELPLVIGQYLKREFLFCYVLFFLSQGINIYLCLAEQQLLIGKFRCLV